MWFIGVEVEQETSAPPPKKNPASAPEYSFIPQNVDDQASFMKMQTLQSYWQLVFKFKTF